jgi:4-aminobutyrate aminotransferase/(S)-3-amino-2-methylpropionate transaminase
MQPLVRTELPGPKSRALMARGSLDMQSFYRALVVDDEKSSGCYMVDADGNVLLDLFAGFALGALGYNHPALVEAARSKAFVQASVNPTSTPFVAAPSWFDVLDGLAPHAPKGMRHIYCVDAGGEGVEAALKVAFIQHGERRRAAEGKPKSPLELSDAEQRAILIDNAGTDAVVIAFDGAFHGRGIGPLSATHSKVVHKADIPAFPWPVAPFPANRFPRQRHAEENEKREAEALRELERIADAYDGRVAAILVEPVQSEGGDRHASASFFQGVQRLARRARAALVLDEVQTGVAISGTLWAHEQLALDEPPDLMCFGKKMQMGGFFCTDAMLVESFGRMYQTRNGDRARGMLAAATLKAIADGDLCAHVRDTGAYFLQALEELETRHPKLMSEARGRGFLLAFDLPTVALRDDFLKRARDRGVFASYTGTRSVRLRPHLITTRADVDIAVGVFDAVLTELR